MMMHATINEEEFFATRYLDIVDARDIDARLTDEITSGLNDKAGPSKAGLILYLGHQGFDPLAYRHHIDGLFVGKIGDTETTTEVQRLQRALEPTSDTFGKLQSLAVLAYEDSSI